MEMCEGGMTRKYILLVYDMHRVLRQMFVVLPEKNESSPCSVGCTKGLYWTQTGLHVFQILMDVFVTD